MTSESILVTWSRPARPNGIITRYHVYINALQQNTPKVSPLAISWLCNRLHFAVAPAAYTHILLASN